MAYNVTDALREMAEELKTSQPSRGQVLEKRKEFSNPVDQFLIPESYMHDQPKLIGTITASYYELRDRFEGHAEFPPNPVNSDAYAWWKDTVSVDIVDLENQDVTVYLEVIFFDKQGADVGKMYNNSLVTWEVYLSPMDYENREIVKDSFNKQYTPLKIK